MSGPIPAPAAAAAPKNLSESIQGEVNGAVTRGNADLKNAIVDHLAGEELKRRKGILLEGLKKFQEMEREVKKASKPDLKTYDQNGKEVSAGYSEAAAKKIRESREKLGRMEQALNKAFNDASYESLEKALKGGGGEKDGKGEKADAPVDES